ncbi:hypothetical protein I302_102036 [Kwoniella bestiolae CBS 10118]|uniref:Uncharacterized protein n=1 Tax=Kwoniella bestiolae CBS 10118 TaxID=1296100 RepID=A0A1B9GE13_9TREE|nr:hypothetical protein I302_00721 [Kwoniella bestiolae CBS 10118]OCF29225.1 hypothetical protein I302_00721 [Kwoniella bestiolae CBS 10118]
MTASFPPQSKNPPDTESAMLTEKADKTDGTAVETESQNNTWTLKSYGEHIKSFKKGSTEEKFFKRSDTQDVQQGDVVIAEISVPQASKEVSVFKPCQPSEASSVKAPEWSVSNDGSFYNGNLHYSHFCTNKSRLNQFSLSKIPSPLRGAVMAMGYAENGGENDDSVYWFQRHPL